MIKHLFAVSMILTLAGCSIETPSEPDSTGVATSANTGSGSGAGSGAGTCRYICTRIVGGNEYQLDDTDPNNPPNRCAAGKQCTPPNPLTCATPGLINNTTCS